MLTKLSKNTKITTIAVNGTILEWYDFALIGAMAPMLSMLFFPNDTKLVALLNIFLIFAAGFFARILGAILLGHMGDKYGRLNTLFVSIIIVSMTTLAVALLPTYAHIGAWAPMLLVTLRFIQGFGLGGETAGGITLLYESSKFEHRVFRASLGFFAVMIGLFLGFIMPYWMTLLLSPAQMQDWGWRIPFIIGGILGLVLVYCRYVMLRSMVNVDDSPVKSHNKKHQPLIQLIKHNPISLGLAMGLYWHASVILYLVYFFIPAFLEQSNQFPANQLLLLRVLCMLLFLLLFYFLAARSKGNKIFGTTYMKIGALGAIVFSLPLMMLMNTDQIWTVSVGMIGLTFLTAIYYVPIASVFSELFPATVRYSGLSISMNTISGIFGGTTPAVMTLLVAKTQNITYSAVYLLLTALVSIYCLYKLRVYGGRQDDQLLFLHNPDKVWPS